MNKQIGSVLNKYFSKYKLITIDKNSTIIFSSDDPTGVYYLRKGYIKMNTITPDGNELTLNIYKPGTFFPMFWAIGDVPNQYSFQAMTQVSLNKAPKNEFIEFLQSNPVVLFDLTQRILRGTDGLITNIRHFLVGNSNHRVASTILMAAKRFGKKTNNGKVIISLSLTHQDIADLAGMTRETTSLAIERLSKLKILKQVRRKFVIEDMEKLSEEASFEDES
jgi:CRP/FNR family transcriptional regulator